MARSQQYYDEQREQYEHMRNQTGPWDPEDQRGHVSGKGGFEGAVSGASQGSTFGPWGALYGGIIGGAIGLTRKEKKDMEKSNRHGKSSSGGFSGDKVPKGYKLGQVQQYTPEQMELYNQQFGQVGPDSYLSRLAGGDESLYAEQEAPALRQFNELQGNTASRFSGAGMGARRSSGFQNQSTAAASNFAQELQSKRQDLQRQALNDLMGYSNQILAQRPYDRQIYQKEEKPSYWSQIAGEGAKQIPGAVASYYSGKGTGGTSTPSSSGSFSTFQPSSSSYTPGSGNYNFPQFGGGAF